MEDASWSEMVADVLDEGEDEGVPEPEDPEPGWHRAESFDPEAIF